ncbi:Rab GTPase [Cavenderia fasciculata]|uniref:Rab GTPase n=1 Tax=Cavenderia fasciculata TaxID=261658 RepID=F4QE31_CACFS|nr:Rab GTPase [Cavenderia fasciculata]EGG13978.1 Rab GTPase [Cavenderia fasciculata]|eukprot:XP_004350686.1 Rab GTPase [Cavenderia fasciculata]
MDEQKNYKIVLIGDTGTGKTSILHRIVFNKYNNEARPTTGTDFFSKTFYTNDTICNLQVWDTSGQLKYWCLTDIFWRTADAACLVFDISDENSLVRLDTWYRQCKAKCLNEDLSERSLPFMVIGNKSDLNRSVSYEQGRQWCKDRNIPLYCEVSARESINVKESITKLIEYLLEQSLDFDNSQYDELTSNESSRLFQANKNYSNTGGSKNTSTPNATIFRSSQKDFFGLF